MGLMTGDTIQVLANTVSANLLAGLMDEFLHTPSAIELFTTGSATGLRAQLLVGPDTVVDDQPIGAANRFPVIPDDFLASAGSYGGGERLILRFRNGTGGNLNVFFIVRTTSLV